MCARPGTPREQPRRYCREDRQSRVEGVLRRRMLHPSDLRVRAGPDAEQGRRQRGPAGHGLRLRRASAVHAGTDRRAAEASLPARVGRAVREVGTGGDHVEGIPGGVGAEEGDVL